MISKLSLQDEELMAHSSMATSAALSSAISTKANPRDLPVIRSTMSLVEETSPNSSKACRRSSSLIVHDRLPTYKVLPKAGEVVEICRTASLGTWVLKTENIPMSEEYYSDICILQSFAHLTIRLGDEQITLQERFSSFAHGSPPRIQTAIDKKLLRVEFPLMSDLATAQFHFLSHCLCAQPRKHATPTFHWPQNFLI